MEAQWYRLQQALNAGDTAVKFEEPFFQRLITRLNDPGAGSADRSKGLYDALACAYANDISAPALVIKEGLLTNSELSKAGLSREPLTKRVSILQIQMSLAVSDVFKRVKRRYLVKPHIDVSLSKAIKDEQYQSYNGLGQQAAVRSTLSSPIDSTLMINLPTGCGKTLVVHALMLMTPSHRLNLVIVPTVGLAIEQAERAKQLLSQAELDHGGEYAWFSGQKKETRKNIFERINEGTQRVLFCSPEAATTSLLPVLFRLAAVGHLGSIIIDEAHLIDAWGAEFRPDFQVLSPLVRSLKGIKGQGFRTILMSATFSPSTCECLKNLFADVKNPPIEIIGTFLRPEPSYDLIKANSETAHTNLIMQEIRLLPRPLILYTTAVKDAIHWYEILGSEGFLKTGLFHGKTDNTERKKLISQWKEGSLDIMVATSAFGVGMDKADVRSVLHTSVPENLDRFYQESGRGGRDGRACLSKLIYHTGQLLVAQKISQDKLIGIDLGLKRWRQMSQTGKRTDLGRLRVSLSTFHHEIQRTSKRNREWNLRTLLLMQRAGFIRLHFSSPETQKESSLESDKQQTSEYYQDYFSKVDIEILDDGHLDKKIWIQRIGLRRKTEKESRQTSLNALTDWLAEPSTSLCRRLAQFYTIDGYAPETSCGGCPGCRANNRHPYTPTLGHSNIILGWNKEQPSNRLGATKNLLRVRYKQSNTQRSLIGDWKHWINALLQTGVVHAIRANQDVLQILKKTLPAGSGFWCAIEHTENNTMWPELVLLMPGENFIPVSYDFDQFQIIVAHENLADPHAPYRKWWECDSQSMPLESFCRKVNYVNH